MTVQRPALRASACGLLMTFLVTGNLAGCSDDAAQVSKDAGEVMPDAQTEQDAQGVLDPSKASQECSSTWQAIQKSIFTAKSCAASTCHGANEPAGGLDLGSEGLYERLINKSAQASLSQPLYLIQPGEQALSFLYRKLAAATDGSALPAGGGSPMPTGQTPLSADQLSALRLWIRAGAPREGVVAGTQGLLDCAQPADADPNKAPRPPVPSDNEGFQHAAGPWDVKGKSENEVCFATYYDLTSSAPDWARFDCDINGVTQTCVGYNRRELSQDAQSHHSIISVYAGAVAVNDPAWGEWRCAGGSSAGAMCDPSQATACGAQGVCQAPPRKMVGCTGFGPNDKEASSVGAGGSQSPVSADRFPDGVYARLPIKGVILWNSHGFNLSAKDTTVEQYNTFWYARPEQRVHLVRTIFNAGRVLINVPPYQQREYCSVYTLPRYAHLTELSAHAHKRSVLWRTWLPPNAATCAAPCMPNEGTPAYMSVQYNDPVVLPYAPALVFDQEDPAARTLKFCSLYDNGKQDPSLLKRASKLTEGAACKGQLYCVAGDKPGTACTSDAECGEGGTCDGCSVEWGVTTEDEMFFLMGNYYVVDPNDPTAP